MCLPISRPLTAALSAALLVSLCVPAGVEGMQKETQAQGALGGLVMSQAGEILPGVAVTLSSEAPFHGTDTTDNTGEFKIEVPTGGDYVLRLEKEGYASFETEVYLAAGEQLSVQIKLLDASSGRRNEAIKAYNSGAKAYEALDLATAKERFLVATAADPSLPEPFRVLADIYLREGSHQKAAAAAEKFLALKPGDQKGQMLAHEAYRKLGNQAKVDELRSALGGTDIAPKLAIQVLNEGVRASQRDDQDTATEKFRAALDLDPDLAEAHAALAGIYYNLERYDEAQESVAKALVLKPDHVATNRLRFLVHDALGDRSAAEKAMASFIDLDPLGAADLLYKRGDLDFRSGDIEFARTALEKVLELDPDLARAHYTLGLIYSSTETAKAKQHLQKFIEMAPDDPEVASAKEMLSYL